MGYQRIIRDNKIIQKGDIDTYEKFNQLFNGIDVVKKRVLDVGCNTAEMGRIVLDKGASYYCGIDARYDFIDEAKRINPEISCKVGRAEDVAGNYDIIIASAIFHYITDHHKFFNQFARVGKMVVMDVWLSDSKENGFFKTERNLFIPSESAFLFIAGQYFKKIENKGPALSPDGSKRFIFHLSEPAPKPAQAVLIYGVSGTGKTTLAKRMFGFDHLQLDQVFADYLMSTFRNGYPRIASVSDFVDGLDTHKERYLKRHADHIETWLSSRVNRNVVIEGYDMLKDDYRAMAVGIAKKLGWKTIEEKHLVKIY